jgi:hypothetical protein
MRQLRQLCCTLTLLCVLATAALADGIMYPDHNPPPPPPAQTGIMYPDGPLAAVLIDVTTDLLYAMTGRT